mmetsp:Transcript_59865/g.106447  ORF Transcript_59865/g.106447 Transcript_59865/m.106447 type:complete len:221 (-) Transcript_59865:143-805(-)
MGACSSGIGTAVKRRLSSDESDEETLFGRTISTDSGFFRRQSSGSSGGFLSFFRQHSGASSQDLEIRDKVSAPQQTIRSPKSAIRESARAYERAAVDALVAKQREMLSTIMMELDGHGRKMGHWIWWVFPTETIGDHDPANTMVTKDTALLLLAAETSLAWRQVLEKICTLLEQEGIHVLPRRDHGRIHFFLTFWTELESCPAWLRSVCKRLQQFSWPKN